MRHRALLAATVAITATLGMAANAAAASITLAWNASSGATGYYLLYGTQSAIQPTSCSGTTTPSCIDVGNQTQYTIPGLTAGATYYFEVEAYNASGTSTPSTEVSGQAPVGQNPPPVILSFSGDSHPDLIWQNQATGQLAEWDMNGTTRTVTNLFNPGAVGPPWNVAGVADFNSDGHLDLLWQNTATGQVAIWLMQGTTMLSVVMPNPATVDFTWRVMAVADFDGDGYPDILWRSAMNGSLAIWYMQGVNMRSTVTLSQGIADPTWSVVGVADFNGDGKLDLLWENTTSGLLAVWYLQGTTVSSAALLNPNSVPDTTWRVAGVGDFNGDGHPDLFWQNSASGAIGVWYMNGVNQTSAQMFTPAAVAPIWKIAAIR